VVDEAWFGEGGVDGEWGCVCHADGADEMAEVHWCGGSAAGVVHFFEVMVGGDEEVEGLVDVP